MDLKLIIISAKSLLNKRFNAIRSTIGASILVAFLAILAIALPQAAKLKGVVNSLQADGTKQVLPGAVVKLSGAGVVSNAPLEAGTDEEGRFTLFNLAPGDYVVTVEVPGFETYTKTYKLLPGAVGDLVVDLKIMANSSVVVVEGGQETINKTDTTNVGKISDKALRSAPLANERFQDALPLLPGVVRGPDGLLNIKGARAGQSGLLVNSTNVTDPVTGDFAISLPIEAIESVSVITSPYSAEFGKFTGAVTAIGTRSGGDKFKFLFTNFFPRLRSRRDPLTGDKKIVGIESFTPRLIFTGPIIKQKLTFSQSFEYRFIRTRIPSLPNFSNDTKLETFDSFSQLDYNASERHHITLNLSFFPQNLSFVNLNTFNKMEVTPNFRQRGFFFSALDRKVFENGSLLESNFAIKQFNAFIFPQSNNPMILLPDFNTGNFFNRQDRFTYRYDGQVTYNLPVFHAKGEHAVKLGTVLSYNTFNGRDSNNLIKVVREDNTISQLISFVGTGRISRNNLEETIFIQDKYSITPSLILDIGLRYDHNDISNGADFAPRLGFLYVPFKDGRTVVRGGIGRFYDKVPLGVGTFPQLQSRAITTFAADGTTILTNSQLFTNTLAGNIRTPYSISGTFEVDRQVLKNLFFRFGFQRREGRDEFIVDPTIDPLKGSLLLLSNGGRSRYQEFQFTTRYKLIKGNEVVFSYVRSHATGDLNDFNTYFGNFRQPIIRANERRRQPFDAPDRFLLTGIIQLPFDLVASPVCDIRTGFPFSQVDEQQFFVGPRNQARFPRFISLDMQVTKGLVLPVLGKKLKTRVGVKIFNLTNHFNPRDVQANIDSLQFGTFFNSVGRIFRGKFEFDF